MNETWVRPSGGNGRAILVGLPATVLGAGLWAVITAVTAREFSIVAMGIGALIGLAMHSTRPTSRGIAVVAALLTVIGCALGEFLAMPAYAAYAHGLGFADVLRYELRHPRLYVDTMSAGTYVYSTVGALVAFSMMLRRIKATRELYVPSGAMPGPSMPGTARPPYAPRQAYGQAAQPGAAVQPYPLQQGHGPGQPPYGQNPQQPYGPGPQGPYGPGRPPYGPGPGQQYPSR